MVSIKYHCSVKDCGRGFDNMRDAFEHEKVPVVEGDFHGVVVGSDTRYVFLVKSKGLSSEHERLYERARLQVNDLYADDPMRLRNGLQFHIGGYNVSEIEKKVEEGSFKSLSEGDILRINDLSKKGYLLIGGVERGTWRTISEDS